MKIHILLLIITLACGTQGCKKCTTCTADADKDYRFRDGDALTVSSGEVSYDGVTYTSGEAFTIRQDSALFENGLQFQGAGTVTITSEFCGKGKSHKDQVDQHEKNKWICGDKK